MNERVQSSRRRSGTRSPARARGERPPARVAGDVLGLVSRPRPRAGGVPVYRDIEAAVDTLAQLVEQREADPRRVFPSSAEPERARRRRRVLRIARSSRRGGCPVRDRAEGGLGRGGARRCADLGYPVAVEGARAVAQVGRRRRRARLSRMMRAVAAAAEDMQSAPGGRKGSRSRRSSTRRDGVELIVGCRRDARFGPLVLVGLGGVYAELLRDVRVALAPAAADELEAAPPALSAAPACSRGARGRRRSTSGRPPR